MYNWIEDLERIYVILEQNNMLEFKNKILDGQLSGGTGWEVFLIISQIIKDLKDQNTTVYSLINIEAERILNYGYKNGFITK